MTITYTINNYTLGARLRSCPTECIVSQEGIDHNHTVVTFQFDEAGERRKAFCDKVLSVRGKVLA